MKSQYIELKGGIAISHREILSRAVLVYVMWLHVEGGHDSGLKKQIRGSIVNKQSLLNESIIPKITSIFNATLEITEDMWAVSYLRKATSQHGFLFIQSENKFYRVELVLEGTTAIRYKEQNYDINEKGRLKATTISNAFNLILWPRGATGHTLAEFVGKTWLIPEPKVQQLLKDVEKDTIKPPQYCQLGGHSLIQPGVRDLLFTLGFIQSARAIAGFGTFLGGLFGWAHIIGAMPTPIYVPLMVLGGIQGAHEMKTFMEGEEVDHNGKRRKLTSISSYCSDVIGKLASQVLIKIGLIKLDQSNEPVLPAISNHHSCATWIIEKLRNLGIKEINDDLTPSLFDAAAYVTSFHLDSKEDKYKLAALFIGGTAICTVVNTKLISNSYCANALAIPASARQQLFDKSIEQQGNAL